MPHVATIAAVMVVATGHSIIGTWLQKSLEASGTASAQSARMHADHATESAYHTPNDSHRSSRDDKEEESDVVVPLLGFVPQASSSSANADSSAAAAAGVNVVSGAAEVGAHLSADARQFNRSGSIPPLSRIVGGSRASLPLQVCPITFGCFLIVFLSF